MITYQSDKNKSGVLITPTKFKNYYLQVCVDKSTCNWGDTGVFYNCVSTIDGYKNTVQMYLHGDFMGNYVLNLTIDEKDDWYIPSVEELQHIYNSKILTHYCSGQYWSSTEAEKDRSYCVSFDYGGKTNMLKTMLLPFIYSRRVYSNG